MSLSNWLHTLVMTLSCELADVELFVGSSGSLWVPGASWKCRLHAGNESLQHLLEGQHGSMQGIQKGLGVQQE